MIKKGRFVTFQKQAAEARIAPEIMHARVVDELDCSDKKRKHPIF